MANDERIIVDITRPVEFDSTLVKVFRYTDHSTGRRMEAFFTDEDDDKYGTESLIFKREYQPPEDD